MAAAIQFCALPPARPMRVNSPHVDGMPLVLLTRLFRPVCCIAFLLTQAISLMKQAQRASRGSDAVEDVLDASAWRFLLAALAGEGLNGEAGSAMQAMVEAGVRVDKVRAFGYCRQGRTCYSSTCVILSVANCDVRFGANDSWEGAKAVDRFLSFGQTMNCCCCCCVLSCRVLFLRAELRYRRDGPQYGMIKTPQGRSKRQRLGGYVSKAEMRAATQPNVSNLIDISPQQFTLYIHTRCFS